MPEDEDVEIGEPRRAPPLPALGRAGLVHDAEAEPFDLDASNLREALPEGAVVVVAPYADEAPGSLLTLIEQTFIDSVPRVDHHVCLVDFSPHLFR